MDIKRDPIDSPSQIPHMLVEHLKSSTTIHMVPGEFTYVVPWSIRYHPKYGLTYIDRPDSRYQKPGGTANTKIIRIGDTFVLDLTAISADDLGSLNKHCHLQDDDVDSLVVFGTVLWPSATQLQLSHLDSASDYDREQTSKREQFNSTYQQIFGISYSYAEDECGFL